MPTKIYLRRGTNSELQAVVLESGEPGWTTDVKRLYIGDGTTSGGIFVGGFGTGVDTVNSLFGDVTLSGGSGIIITVSGQVITIAETAGGLDVDSLNALTGVVNLVGGTGIAVTVSGQSIVIDEEAGGADVDSLNGLIGVVTISGVGTITVSLDGQKIVVSGQDVLDVDSINGLTGVVTVSGAGLVTVTQVGQNIVVSGEDPADVASLNGLVDAVTISGAGTDHVTLNGQIIVISGQDNPVNTYWDDLRTPVSSIFDPPGVNEPTRTAYKGSYVAAFEDQAVLIQSVYWAWQLPHNYKLGTDLDVHVHTVPEDATAGVVYWDFTYAIANIAETFPAQTTVSSFQTMPEVADKHVYDDIVTIPGSGILSLSTMILCSLTRRSDAPEDTFNGKSVYLLEVDMHYQIDSFGSVEEWEK